MDERIKAKSHTMRMAFISNLILRFTGNTKLNSIHYTKLTEPFRFYRLSQKISDL